MSEEVDRPRLVGINHVALEVGDVEEAIVWYGELFNFPMRGRGDGSAYLDMGDQFLALAERTDDGTASADAHRHVGIVVDDLETARERMDELGIEPMGTDDLSVRDPWGNRLQLVEYADIQFTKAEHVLRGMGLPDLQKTRAALAELDEKDMAPD